jgi:hypothetical protein
MPPRSHDSDAKRKKKEERDHRWRQADRRRFYSRTIASPLLRLPRALQVSCLGYLEQREITRVARTCEGLRDFRKLRVCCFPACLCRTQSAHGIATTDLEYQNLPNDWFKCSSCKVSFGCPLSSELWEPCSCRPHPCGDEKYCCIQCIPVDYDDDGEFYGPYDG